MGIRRVKTCDVTGEEVPDDTRADRLTWQNVSYDLYLSDNGREQIVNFLEPVLRGAEEVSTAPQRRKGRQAGVRNDLDAIRAWARDNGHQVADRGRIKAEIVEAYDAAQS